MRRCPNPGCPFRVRHGFAAEFEGSVERCRSCSGALIEPEPEPIAKVSPAIAQVSRRGLVSVGLVAAVVAISSVPIPGLEVARLVGIHGSFAALGLWPSLLAWIGATLVTRAVARRLGPRTSPTTLEWVAVVVSVFALVGGAVVVDSALGSLALSNRPSVAELLAIMAAGLPILFGVRFINDRWGLGHGVGLLLAGLVVHELVREPWWSDDPLAHAAVVATLVVGAAVWMASPTRASATGRRLGDTTDLGLGLMVPSSGMVPVLLLALVPLAWAASPNQAVLITLGMPDLASNPLSLPTELGVVLLLAGGFAWLHTRPDRLLAAWTRAFPKAAPAALRREADGLFRRTLLRSALLVGVVQLLEREHLPALAATILAAILLDLRAELRMRLEHTDLVTVAGPANLIDATSLAQALELERRPALVQGAHHRALYPGLAVWLPAGLLIRASDRERADELAG